MHRHTYRAACILNQHVILTGKRETGTQPGLYTLACRTALGIVMDAQSIECCGGSMKVIMNHAACHLQQRLHPDWLPVGTQASVSTHRGMGHFVPWLQLVPTALLPANC